MKEKYKVESIDHYLIKDWCLHKHYAQTVPSVITHTFGLYLRDGEVLVGVCVFGLGGNNFNNLGFQLLELERLIIKDGLRKYVASYFLSRCIKLLPKEYTLVAYTDTDRHCGYIFQATNWLYTGAIKEETKLLVNGKEFSRKKLWEIFGTSKVEELRNKGMEVETVTVPGKHRYFYLRNDRKFVKAIIYLKYGCKPYPKGENVRSEQNKINIQTKLF